MSAPTHHHGHHHHDHSHGAGYGRAFKIGLTLNLGFVVIEALVGLSIDSLALIADAGHNLGDVMGLLLAWWTQYLSGRAPSRKYTYGLQSSTILAALGNAMLLLIAVIFIGYQAVHRLNDPAPVPGQTVIIVAAIGVLINSLTAWQFHKGQHDDLNLRGAYLHMVGDALISLGVVVSGVIIWYTGWNWVDPVTSLLLAAAILLTGWKLFTQSLDLALHGVPDKINPDDVTRYLEGLPGVARAHDLHIWAMSTNETALTVHLVMPSGHPGDAFLHRISEGLEEQFRIGHATVQIELGADASECVTHSC
ncbi:MAG: cation diffusion facilitator family transporter [Holosporales bacterium]